MNRHVPYDGEYGLHEAHTRTLSFQFRHFEARSRLGAFRWRGYQEHLDRLLTLMTTDNQLVVDFGGAAGPLGLGSVVVDQLEVDALGRRVTASSVLDLSDAPDVVISSHTLEHVPDLDALLSEITSALKVGGTLVAHVPAFSCERWRVGSHANPTYGDHVWTFGLRGTRGVPTGLVNYCEIDAMIARHLVVSEASYVGDDSILVFAQRAR